MNIKEQIYNTIYGAIVGDALGVPVEFNDREKLKDNPVTDMLEYGTHHLPKGSWSDDTSMTLCLADSIGKVGGINYNDIMKRFWAWYRFSKYTPDNNTFDIGGTCLKAMINFYSHREPLQCGPKTERDNGNGSLMRISPLPFYLLKKFGLDYMNEDASFDLIHNISKLTHGHQIALLGCDIYCSFMGEILKGTKKNDLQKYAIKKIKSYIRKHPEYNDAFKNYKRLKHSSFKNIPENDIRSSVFIVDTLEAALWCFMNSDNYKDCVLKAVNLGDDTDTVACVSGSIAGLYYGNIPKVWIGNLRNKKLIDKIVNKFAETLSKTDSVI